MSWDQLPPSASEMGWDKEPPSKEELKPKVETNALRAGIRGMGQVITGGWIDEAAAGTQTLFNDKTYDENLKNIRSEEQTIREANPGSYLGGQLVGGAAQIASPIKFGTTAAAKVGFGALFGAVSGWGSSDADKFSSEAAENATIGGAIGGIIPAVGAGMKAGAANRAEALTGLDATKGFREAVKKGYAPSGKELLEEGKLGWTARGTLEKARAAQEIIGERIGSNLKVAKEAAVDHIKEVDAAGAIPRIHLQLKRLKIPAREVLQDDVLKHIDAADAAINNSVINASDITKKLLAKANEMVTPDKARELGLLNKQIKIWQKYEERLGQSAKNLFSGISVEDAKNVSLADMAKIKSGFDDQIYSAAKEFRGTEGFKVVKNTIKEQIMAKLEAQSKDLKIDQLTLNKAYSRASYLVDAALEQGTRKDAATRFSIADMLISGLGYAGLGPKGIALGIGKKALLETTAGARTLYETGKALPALTIPTAEILSSKKKDYNKDEE